jgi:hypothetical protein
VVAFVIPGHREVIMTCGDLVIDHWLLLLSILIVDFGRRKTQLRSTLVIHIDFFRRTIRFF